MFKSYKLRLFLTLLGIKFLLFFPTGLWRNLCSRPNWSASPRSSLLQT